MKSAFLPILCLIALLPLSSGAQQSPPPAVAGTAQEQVKFLFDWNEGLPWLSYSITVHPDGTAHFDGDPNPIGGGQSEPFQQDFILSAANRQKIFQLAKNTNYFQGNFDYPKKIAQTGRKTLEYESPEVHGSVTYNWSENKDIQELTRIFLAIANTVDYGCKLAYQYRFDKLGMDKRVRELEQLQANGEVEELAAIEPILRKIADDPNLMRITRQSAKHLLKTIETPEPVAAGNSQP